jgi:SAM-dependent methyltransferase
MDLADALAPMAVRTAATLGIADLIESGVTALDTLAARTATHPDALRRLLRYLAARGLFAEPQPGEYAQTSMSRLLLTGHPAHLRERFDLESPVGRADLSFIHLIDSIRTGGPVFQQMYGRSFWEDLDAEPERVASFARMMAANVADSGVLEAVDWSDVSRVVDVGGGNGNLIAEVLQAQPHVHGTVVDLPNTVLQAKEALDQRGLADRCDVFAGSFFEPLPEGADIYLLSKILHDWDDPEAEAILRRCARAAGDNGRVLILEMVLTGSENSFPFTYLDLHMLAYFGGKERTLQQYSDLIERAGLTIERQSPGKWGATILHCGPGGR